MKIPKRFPSTIADQFNFAMNHMYVPEINLIVNLEKNLDIERLDKSLHLCLDAAPLLGCRFVPRWFRPYWQRLEQENLSTCNLIEQGGSLNDFIHQRMDPTAGPQIKAMVTPFNGGQQLVVKVNHQIVDGAGVKEIGYMLADIYNTLDQNPAYRPEPDLGSRGIWRVFRNYLPMHFFSLMASARRMKKLARRTRTNLSFPTKYNLDGKSEHVIKFIEPTIVAGVRRTARSIGATLNDFLVAAMLRAAARQFDWQGQNDLRLIGTVDLRRHIKPWSGSTLCNLSSFYLVDLERELGNSIIDTAARVKAKIDGLKQDYIGLGLSFGNYLSALPYPFVLFRYLTNLVLKKAWSLGSYPIGLTNGGSLDENRLIFKGNNIEYAYFISLVNKPPTFTCSLSSYRDKITLSNCFLDSAVDKTTVQNLFDIFVEELPS
jgi:NRPS condensation-like uncharacterized protein